MSYRASTRFYSEYMPVLQASRPYTIHLKLARDKAPIPKDIRNVLPTPDITLLAYIVVTHTNSRGRMRFAEFALIHNGVDIECIPYQSTYQKWRKRKEHHIDGMLISSDGHEELSEEELSEEELKTLIAKKAHKLVREDGNIKTPRRMSTQEALEALGVLNSNLQTCMQKYSEISDAAETSQADIDNDDKRLKSGEEALNRLAFYDYGSYPPRIFNKAKLLSEPKDTAISDAIAGQSTIKRAPRSTPAAHTAIKAPKMRKSKPITEDAFFITPDPSRPDYKIEKPHIKMTSDSDELKRLANGTFEIWMPLEVQSDSTPHFFIVRREKNANRISEAARFKLNDNSPKNATSQLWLYENGTHSPLTHPMHNMSDTNLKIAKQIAVIAGEDALKIWNQTFHDMTSPHFRPELILDTDHFGLPSPEILKPNHLGSLSANIKQRA